jgi:hypothetical protein
MVVDKEVETVKSGHLEHCQTNILKLIQWTSVTISTLEHTSIDNSNKRNNNSAVQCCLLMYSGNMYIKWWKRRQRTI